MASGTGVQRNGGLGAHAAGACRVLIADDHLMLVDLLRDFLAPHFVIVDSVRDGRALVEVACALQPEIALIDIYLPLLGGIEAGQQIRARYPSIKLVFMAMGNGADLAARAFGAGAAGYLLKTCPAAEVLHALQVVAGGGRYVARGLNGEAIANLPETEAQNATWGLSRREHEVIQLLVRGLPMKEVGRRLGISPRTVAFHKYRGMAALKLRRNADLVTFAIEHGLLGDRAPPAQPDAKRPW